MTLLETASRLRPPELGPDEVRLRAIRQGGNSVEAFRAEIREWLADHWGEERAIRHRRLAERDRGWDPEFSRELGAKGWIGLGWPKAYGGQERSPADQMVFVEELAYAEAPLQVHQMAEMVVGPALIAHGTPEQRAEYLPCILRGEFSCALGYSESEAGSDLASLRTRAERVGEKWIIEGEKMWATNADKASHIWLAARTDRSAEPPHAGISVFLLPLDTPGIQIRPSMSMYGKTFSTTTYQDVAVPETAMVGPVNGGWRVITSALAAERMLIGRLVGVLQRVFDKILDHFRAAESGPQHLGHQADTLAKIGGLAADIEAARQFVFRNALLLQSGRIPVHEAAMTKMFAGELQERLGEGGLDLLGSAGLLSEEPGAPVAELEHLLRHSIMGVIGGGTSEIQRNIIATRGLGLPR
jgi:alkylation response protein AidB-like acyl-CoA dehydrogenase